MDDIGLQAPEQQWLVDADRHGPDRGQAAGSDNLDPVEAFAAVEASRITHQDRDLVAQASLGFGENPHMVLDPAEYGVVVLVDVENVQARRPNSKIRPQRRGGTRCGSPVVVWLSLAVASGRLLLMRVTIHDRRGPAILMPFPTRVMLPRRRRASRVRHPASTGSDPMRGAGLSFVEAETTAALAVTMVPCALTASR